MARKKIYTVIDIETTGGIARRDKITEIGIVTFDGSKIVNTYSSLINPERSIPPEITRITGITDQMVADSPKFYEVAKEIVERTEGTIFVAHNVRFDYSFLKEEFARLGYTFTRRQLCTVRLTRNTFPGLRSYSLGNLIKHFGIEVKARHRALDDALAATKLLSFVLNKDHGEFTVKQIINAGIRESKLPKGITIDFLHSIPESPGVYYFYNTYKKVVYVGKSKNLKSRVMQHFSKTTLKAEKMAKMVASISVEETGSELIAMLLESKEIKYLQPEINKAQKTRDYPYFIYSFYDEQGYLNFKWEKSSIKRRMNKNVLSHYASKLAAKSHLASLAKDLELCLTKCALNDKEGPCYKHIIDKCAGACINLEDPEEYNIRAEIGLKLINRVFNENFIVKVAGRRNGEVAVILVEDGNYRGYGYIEEEDMKFGAEEIKEAINYEPPNPETNRILHSYICKYPSTEIIKL